MKVIIERKDVSQFITGVLELAEHEKSVKTRAVEKKSTEEVEALIKAAALYEKYKDSLTMEEFLPTDVIQEIVLGIIDDSAVDASEAKFSTLEAVVNKLAEENLDEAAEREIAALVGQFGLAGVGKISTGGNHFVMAMILDKVDDEEIEAKQKEPIVFEVDGDVWKITC